jgi:hypothetical protein
MVHAGVYASVLHYLKTVDTLRELYQRTVGDLMVTSLGKMSDKVSHAGLNGLH